ncbi:DUF1835 domain-containing protein [Peribacillus kribbensis]|uniref:DUF1835 domain-containing protein n=1 Tax=Peribacillus kribbensis TaxID=356658 RepID=UPI0004273A2E|nr:DUF1835 domain-containing protein [Peribacillus kribbensis]
MEVKDQYPYIYFFVQHIVFVYKIEGGNYLTLKDVNEKGEWQTYEIDRGEEYKAFHHRDRSPLVGKGYFLSEVDMARMVKEINKSIHRHRVLTKKHHGSTHEYGPYHLISSESSAGALKVGLDRPKTVIGFPDFFAFGPLWSLHEKSGWDKRSEWLFEHINFDFQSQYEYETNISAALQAIEDIPEDVPIYIWYGTNVEEQIGLRFFIHQVKDKTNEVFLINATEFYEKSMMPADQHPNCFHTNHIDPKDLKVIFHESKNNQPVSHEELCRLQREWRELTLTKEVLRIWSHGEIQGMKEDHYDSLILDVLKQMHYNQPAKDFMKTGSVIGTILGTIDELISDSFLEYRIRHLVYSGVLELKGVPKSMRHYSVKVR